MKRLYVGFAVVVLVLFGLLGFVRLASASSFHTGSNVVLSQREIHDSLYVAGRTIDINNTVDGDVFCAGQNVTVNGTIHGDVICAGQNVTVNGTVDGDVRLAGQTVTLGANVLGNATVGGQSFTLTSTGQIGGDLTTGSTDATLNGKVGRDLVIGSTNVILSSSVGRNITAQANAMKLTSTATVGGNIALTSSRTLDKEAGAIVSGSVTRTKPSEAAKPKHAALFGFGFIWFVYWLLAMLLAAILLTLLFPKLFHSVTDQATPWPWKALLVGFVASLAAPVVIVLFTASVVGIPLAFILALGWIILLLLSGPAFGYYLGRLILRGNRSPLLYMLVGTVVLVVLYFVPVIGTLAVLAAIWFGTGMLLLDIFRATPRPTYKRLPALTS